jgi:hypothetical protein
MIVDCMTCPVRGRRCDDCAVTVLSAPRVADRRGSAGGPQLALPSELRSTPERQGAPEPQLSPEPQLRPEPQLTPELQLDAAEHRVVSMFVGAGLVKAGAAVGLRARRESVERWGTVRDVG